MHNIQIIKINISNSFIHRARCAKCGNQPKYYYISANPILYNDPNKNKNNFKFIKKYYKRISSDHKIDDFRFASKLNYYNHSVNYKSYNPKLHRVKGADAKFNLIESLTCECGYTFWYFTEKSIKNRSEILNRKSKISKLLND